MTSETHVQLWIQSWFFIDDHTINSSIYLWPDIRMLQSLVSNHAQQKMILVTESLFAELKAFNERNTKYKQRDKKYAPKLTKHRPDIKWKWIDDVKIIWLDEARYTQDLATFTEINATQLILIVSQKSNRILWFWYQVLGEWGKTESRIFIRYWTLNDRRVKAQTLIELMNQRFWKILWANSKSKQRN